MRRLHEARSAGDAEATQVLHSPLAFALHSALTQVENRAFVMRTYPQSDGGPRGSAVTLAHMAYDLTPDEGLDPALLGARARLALLLDPTCVDAVTYLGWRAEEAGDLAEAEERYVQGVALATAKIAPERLTGSHRDDDFWLHVPERPYMRARAALARLCWRQGRLREAAAIYEDLVRLAPYDGQGNRYCLVQVLAACGDYATARKALDRHCHDEAGAEVTWSRALLTFALEGPGTTAEQALQEALRDNRHVPAYLLDPRPVPWRPSHYSAGSVEEAICYTDLGKGGWQRADGALAWLTEQAGTAWTERQETERALARTSLSPDQLQLTHYRAVRALTELADRLSEAERTLYHTVPALIISRAWRTIIADKHGCWLWAGSSTLRHKGVETHLESGLLAHAIVNGRAIPPTAQLLASCGGRGCINPQHHHNIEVLATDGIVAELAVRTGKPAAACRPIVLRALARSSVNNGLQDGALPHAEDEVQLVRRELVDPWLEQQQ